jgi:prepilin-type N-terminal cleavage/methylation domain-containing protein
MQRLRSERGMTLIELLVTLVIAVILSLATFSLVEVTMKRSGEISARTDTLQRARGAMDAMTRQLRSQVCLGSSPARTVTSATPTSITFSAYMGDPSTKASQVSASATPTPIIAERRSLTLEGDTIVERRWTGTPNTAQAVGYTFPTNATGKRDLLKPVELVTPTSAPLTSALFRYYAYNPSTGKPDQLLDTTTALTEDQMRQIARIEIRYRALPTPQRRDGRAAVTLVDDVFARTIDPNADTDQPLPCQ